MKTFLVALAIVALALPAYAQGKSGGKRRGGSDTRTDEVRKKRSEASEKAYKSALDKIPNKPYDPWQNIREKPQPK